MRLVKKLDLFKKKRKIICNAELKMKVKKKVKMKWAESIRTVHDGRKYDSEVL